MEEIKTKEYIYNRYNGQISKYKKLDDKRYIDTKTGFVFDMERHLILGKTSGNIIDLIEVGDIVHTRDVLNEDYYHMFNEEMVQATKETIQEGISLVDIMTKEQYNANCYRLEE